MLITHTLHTRQTQTYLTQSHCLNKQRGRKRHTAPGNKYTQKKTGRVIAQAVSRRVPTAAARVQTRVWSCGIL
jgi:hypothetical protein